MRIAVEIKKEANEFYNKIQAIKDQITENKEWMTLTLSNILEWTKAKS